MSRHARTTLLTIPSPAQGVWHLGPVPLRGYALCIIVGIVAAIWIGERRWVARGGRPGEVADLAIWAVRSAWSAAGSTTSITDWQLYFGEGRNPVTALYVWRGGLGIWGAIALGALGVVIGARRKGIKLLPVLDAIAPGVLVAQALGRWGNWFNQELFGRPTDLPWGLEIDPAHRPDGLRRRRDVPPDVPLRVPLVPGGLRGRGLGRPPVPARPRPGGRALRHGLHARARLDRDAADRRRPAGRRLRAAAQRVDLDRAVRARRGRTSWSVAASGASYPRPRRTRPDVTPLRPAATSDERRTPSDDRTRAPVRQPQSARCDASRDRVIAWPPLGPTSSLHRTPRTHLNRRRSPTAMSGRRRPTTTGECR